MEGSRTNMLADGASEQDRSGMLIASLIVASSLFIEVFFAGGTFLFAPTYIAPLISNQMGLTMTGLLLTWQLLGFAFLCSGRKLSAGSATIKGVLVVVFCTVPCLGFILMGPAVVTIAQAFGPLTSK